jgi:hypothetical protein
MSRAAQRSTSSPPFLSRSRVQLHPKQAVAFFSTATEICAGSGGAVSEPRARGEAPHPHRRTRCGFYFSLVALAKQL